MGAFLLRRLLALAATLFGASLVIFLVMEVLPGDPAAVILGTGAREDTLAALRAQMGLDLPAHVRFLGWWGEILTGSLGASHTYGSPVTELVGERIGVTVPLAIMAILLSTAIAIPAGVFAAARHNTAADAGVMGFAQLGVAVPNFWFAMLLILVFAVWLGWVPAGGFAGWDKGWQAAVVSLLLPALALALPQAAILARVTRSSVLETMGEDYVRTARAGGLTRTQALWRHAVRNALIPVVTIMGLQFSFLLVGTIIIENVFYLPGVGRLMFQAIAQRDLIVVQSLLLIMVAAVVTVNFAVDVAYVLLDPRLRLRGRGHG